jgi:hypothetical protein
MAKSPLKKRPSATAPHSPRARLMKRPGVAKGRETQSAVSTVAAAVDAQRPATKQEIKTIPPRRTRGKNPPGGLVFPKSSFEDAAKKAAAEAPQYLRQKLGYPLPLLGSLTCSLKGFEKDLDGVRVDSLVVFEWRFSHQLGGARVEGVSRHKHRASTVYHARVLPRPPRSIRVLCCVVTPLVASVPKPPLAKACVLGSVASRTEALLHECLPSKAVGLAFLRQASGGLPGAAYARRIVAIGAPKPITKLPRIVKDPAGVDPCLLLLAPVCDTQFLAIPPCHGPLSRRSGGCFNYFARDIRLVAIDEHHQLVPLKNFPDVPSSLREVNGGPLMPPHAGLRLAWAMAGCMTEAYNSAREHRDANFAAFIDTNAMEWSDRDLNRKLVVVWEDATGLQRASASPNLYQLVKLCSGAHSPARSID